MMLEQAPAIAGKDAAGLGDIDEKKYIRIGYLAIAIGLGGFLLWAMLAPLDQGVPGMGVVTVIDQRVVVQHQSGGLIEEMLIKEGDRVAEGQVIARLNPKDGKAQAETLRAQYRAAKSEQARLIAETSGRDFVPSGSADARLSAAMKNQAALLRSNRAILKSELESMQEALIGLEKQVTTYRDLYENRKRQSELAKQQLNSLRELTAAGFSPKNKLLDQEQIVAEQDVKLGETQANLARLDANIQELHHKINIRQREFQRESEAQLAKHEEELLSLKARVDAAEFYENRFEIIAPVNGVAVGLRFHGKGEVIPPGGRVVDIVPENEQLIIEAKFSPDFADELRASLEAEIRFSGLNRFDLPVIDGEVMTISADRLIDEATQMPYFLARVQISKRGMEILAKHKVIIQPGMPADVLVKTGERTLFNYLIAPVKDRMEWAFIEK